MPYVQINESEIYYQSAGSGPTLVFSHGVGGNHASWYYQIAALAARYRTIIWDHRGFGLSSDTEALGRAGFIGDLEQLLNALEIDKCVLIGQSMGGGTSLGFTCNHPERVAGLVMADSLSAAALPDKAASAMKAAEHHTQGLSQLERVLGNTFRAENPAAAILYSQIASFNATNLQTLQGAMPSFSPGALTKTGVPTLFVVGDEDILFPPEAVRCYQEHVPGSEYVLLEKTGHSAFFEQPEKFNAALERWLVTIGYAPQ